jgi:hypothetical protein
MIPPESYSARSVPESSQRKEVNKFRKLEFKGDFRREGGRRRYFIIERFG